MSFERRQHSLREWIVSKDQLDVAPVEGLRACRVAAALTQRELAELVGSNQTTIANLEKWADPTPYAPAAVRGIEGSA